MYTISQQGIDLIKSYEGLKLEAYLCPAKVWTIGYGSTGTHVKKGLKITEQQAEQLLLKDISRFISGVNKLIKVSVTQGMFDALVSFSFNLGLGRLESSTLLKHVNSKEFTSASLEFAKWNKAGGKVLSGLTKRREAEYRLFLS